MKIPCMSCKYEIKRESGHRTFVGCSDLDRKARGFNEDTFLYWHKCSEQELKDECEKCQNLKGIYCENVYAECKFIAR